MPKRITRAIVRDLAAIHVNMYDAQLAQGMAGNKGVNVRETEHYLKIWRSMKLCGFAPSQLNTQQRNEIEDAIDSEEWARLVGEAPSDGKYNFTGDDQ